MARDLNIWIGTGRLGKDVDLRYTNTGKAVCNVGMACQFDDKTEWIDVVLWDKAAENLAKYCGKGSFIRVTGRLANREWEKDGVKHRTREVVASDVQFLDSRGAKPAEPSQPQSQPAQQQPPADSFDDDVPF